MLDSFIQLENCDGLELDIRLATSNNFTGRPLYQKANAYVHRDTATKLETAKTIAFELGLTIRILDAFRPLEVQQMLWDHTPNPNYISPPDAGQRTHCRGIAIDLTLVDNASGQALEMGTEFDDFRELAHHNNTEIGAEALRNRLILAGLMHTAGFCCINSEWWHYQLPDIEHYDLLSDQQAGTQLLAE